MDSDEEADHDHHTLNILLRKVMHKVKASLTVATHAGTPAPAPAPEKFRKDSSGVYRSISSGLHVMKLAPSSPATRMFEASRRRALDLGLLTWNINGNPLSAEDAKAWAECAGPADAYFVAIQELIDIEAKEGLPDRAVREANSAAAASAAAATMQAALSAVCGEHLVPLCEPIAMLAIFLVGFARPALAADGAAPELFVPRQLPAHYTEEAAAALDLAGHETEAATVRAKVGQKGGVAVGLRLGGRHHGLSYHGGLSLVVMSAHLPAGDKPASSTERDLAANALRRALPLDGPEAPVFIMCGDVNSRTRLDAAAAKQLVADGSLREVLEADELYGGYAQYALDLAEAEILWGPSYKFKKGVKFDDKRAPSYCDRVLWNTDASVVPRLYMSVGSVTTSDHKPVAAVLSVALPDGAMENPNFVPSKLSRRVSIDQQLQQKTAGAAPPFPTVSTASLGSDSDPQSPADIKVDVPASKPACCTLL